MRVSLDVHVLHLFMVFLDYVVSGVPNASVSCIL